MKHLTQDFLRNKQSRAIGAAFFSIGFLFGTWATFIPYVKERFGLNDADLGLILLSMPIGTVTANLVGSWLVSKVGMKTTTIGGVLAMALAFLIPINAPVIWLLPPGLYLCGATISITNIAQNMGVTSIEEDQKINIMSTCHGMFSVGLMLSSLLASLARGMGAVPGYYMIGVSTLVFILGIYIRPTVFSIKDDEGQKGVKSRFFLPKGSFLIMILIGVFGNIAEGTMADWTSVYMRDIVKSSPYFVGWGLAGYSLMMSLGRLFGDGLIPKIGANKVLVYGGLLSAIGLGIAILFPYVATSILGFAMVGAGVSCAAPILYASASRVPGVSKSNGLAIMNTFAMGGFMAGPVLIGFISEASSLTVAFGLVLLLALSWAFLSKNVRLF
ncbi:MFS transporter [Jiulongibacter sp. NS-SX5]|uniref:MFS transporter n=1 Tax=Jiulongibacter sp. NS-SX5 TaxID=3463854 RepID=UPI00405A1582